MTLVEFLLARIFEDEAVALRVQSRQGDHPQPMGGYDCWEEYDLLYVSPVRVLTECEAKRAIVATVGGWQHVMVEDCWYSCAATYGSGADYACCDDGRADSGCDCGLDVRVSSILGPLAVAYANHPDYRDEWRP